VFRGFRSLHTSFDLGSQLFPKVQVFYRRASWRGFSRDTDVVQVFSPLHLPPERNRYRANSDELRTALTLTNIPYNGGILRIHVEVTRFMIAQHGAQHEAPPFWRHFELPGIFCL